MSTVLTAHAQIGTNKSDAKYQMQGCARQSTDQSFETFFIPVRAVMDSPHSEQCAGTQIWAGHCRCYNSSLWTSLHPPRRPQTSSSSETAQTHTTKHANMNMIKRQNGTQCRWTLQCVRGARLSSGSENSFPSDCLIHYDSLLQNMLMVCVRTHTHEWFWLQSWKQWPEGFGQFINKLLKQTNQKNTTVLDHGGPYFNDIMHWFTRMDNVLILINTIRNSWK